MKVTFVSLKHQMINLLFIQKSLLIQYLQKEFLVHQQITLGRVYSVRSLYQINILMVVPEFSLFDSAFSPKLFQKLSQLLMKFSMPEYYSLIKRFGMQRKPFLLSMAETEEIIE